MGVVILSAEGLASPRSIATTRLFNHGNVREAHIREVFRAGMEHKPMADLLHSSILSRSRHKNKLILITPNLSNNTMKGIPIKGFLYGGNGSFWD